MTGLTKMTEMTGHDGSAYFAPGAFRGWLYGSRVQQRSTRAFKGVLNTFWQMVSGWVTTPKAPGGAATMKKPGNE